MKTREASQTFRQIYSLLLTCEANKGGRVFVFVLASFVNNLPFFKQQPLIVCKARYVAEAPWADNFPPSR